MLCLREMFESSVVADPLVELSHFVPESRHERCNMILRGTERIVDSSKRLFYEVNERIKL